MHLNKLLLWALQNLRKREKEKKAISSPSKILDILDKDLEMGIFFFFIIWRIDFGGIFSFPTMFSFLVCILCILQSSATWLNHIKLYRPWKPQLKELPYSLCGAVSPCWLYTAHLTQKPEGKTLPHVALGSARASQVTYAVRRLRVSLVP